MRDLKPRVAPEVMEGARAGFVAGLRETLAGVTAEPLPMEQIDLILALRRRERERAERQAR